MNDKMAMFLFEVAQKGAHMKYKTNIPQSLSIPIFTPYNQWPKYQPRAPYMDRPLFEGHKTYPQHSRPGFGIALGSLLTHPVGFVIGLGIAAPLLSHSLAHKYPHMAVQNPMSQEYMQMRRDSGY